MVLSLLLIGALALVLCKKIMGAYIFLVLQIVNCVVQSVLGLNNVVAVIFVTVIMCGIFAGLLCLRNNGISGWKFLRNNQLKEQQ